jgi:hypothetical protein
LISEKIEKEEKERNKLIEEKIGDKVLLKNINELYNLFIK